MKEFTVWQPIHTGFAVKVTAENEDGAIESVLQGNFDNTGVREQILQNQQTDGMPEICQD